MRLLLFLFFLILLSWQVVVADTVKIEFTADDSYSIEVANINVGDTIEWLPKNEGHNVEFLAGPNMEALPEKSDLNVRYAITFDLPGVYLYQCTPHGNMGMLGLIVVGNNLDNLGNIEAVELSRVAKSVLQRLIRVAKSNK
jgi:pseudoazurin